MTVTRFRTSLVAVAFAAMAGLTFFGPLVTSGGPVAADAPWEAELNRAATVLKGPLSRNNRVQAALILDTLLIDEIYIRASVNRADGSLFAESGEASTDAETVDLPVGRDGATLRVEFAPAASAAAEDGAVGPMAYLAPLGLLAALLRRHREAEGRADRGARRGSGRGHGA